MISVVIPTYRGEARLRRNLPSVAESLSAAGEPWEIVVVDDGGGVPGPLAAGARLVQLPANRGYGPAVNAGVRASAGESVLVLNDDVRLEPGTVRALLRLFPDPGLFAVVPAIRSPLAACGDEGGKAGRWRAGLLEIVEAPAGAAHPTLYPVGCCFLCPRDGFLALGGYDDAFAPFLWEDVDLGYRAWRSGLRIVHAPEAVCHHEGSATLKESRSLQERERMSFRNRTLFHLLNVQAPELRAECLGAFAAYALFEALPERQQGLAQALDSYAGLPRRERLGLSDEAILGRVAGS